MKKKYLILLIVLIFNSLPLYAKSIDQNSAKQIAENWNTEGNFLNPNGKVDEIITSYIDTTLVFYICNFDDGYVIVSSSDNVIPVIGYNFEHQYSEKNHPPQFDDLLESYKKQIKHAIINKLPSSKFISEEWVRLDISTNIFQKKTNLKEVTPLLSTIWNQGQYYNEMCPIDYSSTTGNNHVWAGCVATAMAQVMKYWEYPIQGSGSHGYSHPDYGYQYANFGNTTYNWSNMPDNVTNSNTDIQTLLYHCGVAVDMDYAPDGSGAYSEDVPGALINYFSYNQNAYFADKDDYSTNTWENMIRNELDNGRPLYYSGHGTGGHAFNLDGYQGTSYFHFNWGWSGSYNGYYYLSNLNPGTHSFTQNQATIIDLFPSAINSPDLTVQDIWTVPTIPIQNQLCTLYATVKNVGNQNSASTTHNWYWPSNNLIASSYVSALSPSQETTITQSYTFTSSGTNSYKGYVESVSGETNINNNEILESLTVSSSGGTNYILVVDHDLSEGGYTDCWPFYETALIANGITYTYFQVQTDLISPDLATMQMYDCIIWFSGECWGYYGDDCMTPTSEGKVASYLDGGGSLFFAAQDYLWASYPTAGALVAGQFPHDYLGLTSVSQDVWFIEDPDIIYASGVTGSVASGYSFTASDIFTTAKDGLYIDEAAGYTADAMGLFQVDSPAPVGICAVQKDTGVFRSIFSTIAFAAINDPTTQANLLGDIINWLIPSSSSPDLTVTDIWTVPSTPTQGQSCTLYAKVKNIGDANSSSTNHEWYWPSSTLLTSILVQGLNPNQEVTVFHTYTFTSAGTNTFKGYVEPVSGEQNTSNNDKQESLTVEEQIINNMTLSLPTDATGAPGESVSIPLTLDNPDGIGIEGIDVTVTFESVLDATGATLTGGVLENEDYTLQVNTGTNGEIELVIYANLNLYTGGGIIAYLEFLVVGYEGDTTTLHFTSAEVNETPVDTQDGFFEVIPDEFDICGYIGYWSNNNPVRNVLIDLTGDGTYSTITDVNGDYTFNNIIGGNYILTPNKYDDLGGLSGMDASRAARFAAGLITLDCYEMIAADVTMDGTISGMDASRIARRVVGLIDYLNDDEIDWVFVNPPCNSSNWPPIVYESTYVYDPLNTDMTEQDFTAVRLGDVTGNWTPGSLKNETPLAIASIQMNKDYSLKLPIVINNSTSIEGIDIVLKYDQKVLLPINITLNNTLENYNYALESLFKGGTGNIIIYAQEQAANYSDVVATVNFEVIGSSNEQIDLVISNLEVNESQSNGGFVVNNGETITRALKINQDQQYTSRELMCSISPNPCSSHTMINYSLQQDGNVKILLYNTRGQLIETLNDNFENAGENHLTLKTDKLKNGIYFCKIIADNQTKNVKLLIMK